jgi:tRNA uridine 5-carboxymethylaminomethyl modification enzyme
MEEQLGDEHPEKFSFSPTTRPLQKQRSCWITYTNRDVHQTLETGFDRSPMFNGRIQGLGPRYCPSIEDKINRFAERERHQIFVEPEGWNTVEIYVNGFSTSLPEDVQYAALRKIPGFEQAKMFRPGYAIEYDYFPPTQLKMSLETQAIERLFFAGQINGTTGYEEAACQGLMAGINAYLSVQEKEPFVLQRSEAYIGVLIDDLVNKGTEEPYRMFTSRAEFRLSLRQDNADIRLTESGYRLGLASEERYGLMVEKKNNTSSLLQGLGQFKLQPEEINPLLTALGTGAVTEKTSADKILKRPQLSMHHLKEATPSLKEYLGAFSTEVLEQAEIQLKYDSYLEKERLLVEKVAHLEHLSIPSTFDYLSITALSNEGRHKLHKIRPETLGQAARISGVSPADVSILTVYLGR